MQDRNNTTDAIEDALYELHNAARLIQVRTANSAQDSGRDEFLRAWWLQGSIAELLDALVKRDAEAD